MTRERRSIVALGLAAVVALAAPSIGAPAAPARQIEPPRPAPVAAPADDLEGRFGEPLATIDGLADPLELAFDPDGSLWILLARDGGCAVVDGIELGPDGRIDGRFDAGRLARRSEPCAPFDFPGADALRMPDGTTFTIDGPRHEIAVSGGAGAAAPRRFGGYGPHPGFFASPRGLAYDAGRLYVADCENHRIQVFDANGRYLYDWGIHALRPREGVGRLHYPTRVAIAPGGGVAAVLEPLEDRVQLFGPARGPVAQYKTDPTLGSVGVAAHYGPVIDCDGPFMVLIETERQTVLLFDGRADPPVEIGRCGGYGERAGQFQGLADVVLDAATRRLWTVDAAQDRLTEWRFEFDSEAEPVFDPARIKLIRSRGELGLTRGLGASGSIGGGASVDLTRAEDGRLHLLDAAAGEMIEVSADLRSAERVGAAASGDLPTALALSYRVCALDRSAGGSTYAVDRGLDRVVVFEAGSADPATISRSWGGRGIGPGEFWKPSGIAIDGRGRVLVVDHGNHRVQVFEQDGTFVTAFGSRLYVLPALEPAMERQR